MYVFAVYASRATLARAFGTVGHAYATKCETCEKGQSVRTTLKEFEDVSAVSNRTEREDIWLFLKTTTRFICFAI